MKLDDKVRRFLALERAHGLTEHTVRTTQRAYRECLATARRRGKKDPRDVAADDVVLYLAELVDEGLAEATIRARLYKLRRVFGFLLESGFLLMDPTAGIKRRYVEESMRAWLTEEEALRLLAAPRIAWRCYEVRNRAILEVLYSTGLRLGELARLELDDLDLASGYVTVRTSKNGDGRVVPLGREAQKWVRRYLQDVRPVELDRSRGRQETRALVFLTGQGRPLRSNLVNGFIARYAAAAEIDKHVTAHVLRHTCAMHLLKNGASTPYIQAMLGHRGLRATQRYTRLLPLELRDVHRKAHPRGRRREE